MGGDDCSEVTSATSVTASLTLAIDALASVSDAMANVIGVLAGVRCLKKLAGRGLGRAAFRVQRTACSEQRSACSVQGAACSVQRSAFRKTRHLCVKKPRSHEQGLSLFSRLGAGGNGRQGESEGGTVRRSWASVCASRSERRWDPGGAARLGFGGEKGVYRFLSSINTTAHAELSLDGCFGLRSLFDDRIDFASLTTESRISTIVSHRGSNVFHD
jgi:hypothetical protein